MYTYTSRLYPSDSQFFDAPSDLFSSRGCSADPLDPTAELYFGAGSSIPRAYVSESLVFRRLVKWSRICDAPEPHCDGQADPVESSVHSGSFDGEQGSRPGAVESQMRL
ncbi:hypothetical protein N7539_005740 [Penicillium diatomitis]|uniref:Uncharacterized protein n=1 Tax=Penicillium diatomitis TaxID=2819901 RepID=A0A9W9X501_9EURO|nr:uncharacterized protein N7539_005740 [Penicillium diatomitis]KAJ5483944.1 hypothetical protein N7539_005740 [Penicillium diatomitis]